MRRGLMAWDPQELPEAVLADRIARLRAAMQREKLDAFLIYTNLVRPSAVCWLTGFTPYWSEGALLVLGSGAPIFATALSKRVATWMRTTDPVGEISNAPRPGKVLGERLTADRTVRRVGVLELDALPSGLYDDVVGVAPSVELSDASASFAGIRRTIDDAERRLLARADAIAGAALDRIDAAHTDDAGTVAGLVEQHARLAGAEEAYIAVATDLDADRRLLRIVRPTPLGRRFAVRASVAYKGAWVRRMRTFARDEPGRSAVADAEAWFDELCHGIDPGKGLTAQLDAESEALAGATLQNWMVESCVGSYPLQVVAAHGIAAAQTTPLGDALVLTLSLTVGGVPWLGAAPHAVIRA
ncbi:MAG: hypothetical protein GEU91_21220 [Rhizobiales bacterium]|nr:hypothetical protein [Hyphomicrobiales bacterium]